MDFLEIRRKAKERAASGQAAQREASASPAAAAPARDDAPALEPAAAVAGELAAELQRVAGRSEVRAGGPDPRFTTWRPGSGERPFFAEPDAPPPARSAPADLPGKDPELAGASPTPHEPRAVAPAASVAPAAASVAARERRPDPVAAAPAPARPRSTPGRNPLDEFFYREDEELPGLPALPGEAEPAEDAAHEDTAIEEYLTFELATEEYAVAIERVREVLKAQPITEVPRAPAGILGVVTVRGEVVAVFDPRRRLGLPGPPPPEGVGRIVIVDDGEGPCGLLVDAVASVVRLARGSIEPCPQGIGGASADCLAGIGRERSRLFTVLDLGALLRRAAAAPRGGRAAHAGA